MKILVMAPKDEFTKQQQQIMSAGNEVVFTKNRKEYPLADLNSLAKDVQVLAFDPDNIGGFEVTPKRLMALLEAMPKIKGLALSTTAFGYIDFDFCKKRGISVTYVPYYSTESVAEHTLSIMLGCAKRIFVTDRLTQKGEYQLVQGFELKGKTLGIIGLGHIGSRTAELGKAIGMKVIAWNRTPKEQSGVMMKSLDEVVAKSDVICLHLAENKETKGILSKERISKLKKGVIVVNTADRSLVDEVAMASALKKGVVDTYALEAEDMTSPPLGGLENAIFFKGFGWFTKEALERNKQIWVDNIVGLCQGNPPNKL